MNKKNLILLILSLLIITGGVIVYNIYGKIYKPNVVKDGFIFIKTNSTLTDVENEISSFLKQVKSFVWVAKRKNYQEAIKPGKYKIIKGFSNHLKPNCLALICWQKQTLYTMKDQA